MANLDGRLCRLRAMEPQDVDTMYRWENDTSLWSVSGTLSPFSRHAMEMLLQMQQYDIFSSRQQRLVVETLEGESVGAIDLFEVDALHRRAGVGILIYDAENRSRGYAADALAVLIDYCRNVLNLRMLWCNIESDNEPSKRLFLRAGFTLVGVKREWNLSAFGAKDEELYQKML